MPTDFIGLFAIMAVARVRFVLVGGLAQVLHGLDRLTAAVDLVIDLSAESARHMQVFSFWDSANTRPTVDVLLAPPVPFEDLWASASVMNIGGHEVRVASIEHLIRMKAAAGRAQDLADIERLRARLEG